VATEPLDPAVAQAVSPKRRMFVNTKNLLFYWRLSPDGRMVFGGRRSLQHATVADAADHLVRSMREVHPQLADVAVTHRWGGNVAVTLDRMPHVGRMRGAWYATGCNGSGVALNTWLGHRLGEVVLGTAPPPSFAELRHRPIPLHRFRKLYLPLVGQWFRYQDRP
jgi:glycine/D-amino acid oxidase-like deaminating enzyme